MPSTFSCLARSLVAGWPIDAPYLAQRVRRPVPDDASGPVPLWVRLNVLIFLISTFLLTVPVLCLLVPRKSERRADQTDAGHGGITCPPSNTAEDRVTPRPRLSPKEVVALRAGLETAFGVMGMLRELVNEALASTREEARPRAGRWRGSAG